MTLKDQGHRSKQMAPSDSLTLTLSTVWGQFDPGGSFLCAA